MIYRFRFNQLWTINRSTLGHYWIRIIIDGQQRLATLTMILSGIRTVYKEHNDERAEEVYTDYLGIKDRRTRIIEPRLGLNVTNESIFQSMVVEDAPEESLASATKNKAGVPSNQLMCTAMKFLRSAIRERSNANKKYETFLLELEDFVRDRVVMVLMLVRDEADAYLIFETLNDRGLDLSTSDLLKNYILGKAGNRLEAVRKQWEENGLSTRNSERNSVPEVLLAFQVWSHP